MVLVCEQGVQHGGFHLPRRYGVEPDAEAAPLRGTTSHGLGQSALRVGIGGVAVAAVDDLDRSLLVAGVAGLQVLRDHERLHRGADRGDRHGGRLAASRQCVSEPIEDRQRAKEVHAGDRPGLVVRTEAGAGDQPVEGSSAGLPGSFDRPLPRRQLAEIGDHLGVVPVDADDAVAIAFEPALECCAEARRASRYDDGAHGWMLSCSSGCFEADLKGGVASLEVARHPLPGPDAGRKCGLDSRATSP